MKAKVARRGLRYGLLLGLLLAFGVLKGRFDIDIGPSARDGDYYYSIARSWIAGEGFRSNISLYFQGFQSFPHRVSQSPVWPLTLGVVGGFVGLGNAATGLPNLLYLVDLVLVYFLARRLYRGIAGERPGWAFGRDRVPDFGHAAVLVLGANVVFFRFSSVPNNEALALCFVFSGLILFDRAVREERLLFAVLAGLSSGLALMTRVQALALPFALWLTLTGWVLVHRRSAPLFPALLAGTLLPFIPWILYLASWNDALSLRMILGMETLRETPTLPVFEHAVISPTWWAAMADRISGLVHAFSPSGPYSYTRHFGGLVYLLPLAAIHLGVAMLRGRRRLHLAPSSGLLMPIAALITGVGMLLPVHLLHMAFDIPWLFGTRHGLPLLLLILPALAYLDARTGRFWRVVGVGGFVVAILGNLSGTVALSGAQFKKDLGPNREALVEWLDGQDPKPSVITTRPWQLGAFSRSGFHWILCQHSHETSEILMEDAGADYIVVFPSERKCDFVHGFQRGTLRVVKSFGEGGAEIRVMARRRRAGTPP
ncbi:hypothetical protein MK489_17175 [Myxococcota bacterium]|nr:hypothetical protein [Myxococcota bacterium]